MPLESISSYFFGFDGSTQFIFYPFQSRDGFGQIIYRVGKLFMIHLRGILYLFSRYTLCTYSAAECA